mmetsp:Transcript_30260/g.96436  ORF Transcript_30260/g.96436 Transcript_30260/m.96436 type:complete len:158 (-) Transcript_30260:117-590(-)
MFVVLQTACNPKSAANRAQASIAIGLAVFAANCILIPIDGCSINPARSFGPAIVALARNENTAAVTTPPPSGLSPSPGITTTGSPRAALLSKANVLFADMWIFWVGPLVGSALAVVIFKILQLAPPRDDEIDGVSECRSPAIREDEGDEEVSSTSHL